MIKLNLYKNIYRDATIFGARLFVKLRAVMRRDIRGDKRSETPRYSNIWHGLFWRLDDSLQGLKAIHGEEA